MMNQATTVFKIMRQEARAFASNESGVTSIEYALIGALIAVVIVGSVTNVGAAVKGLYEFVAKEVAGAVK